MISRDIDFDGDIDPDPGIVQYAKDCEVCFSSFVGESGLLQCMISQLSLRDKAVLFAYAVSLSRSGIPVLVKKFAHLSTSQIWSRLIRH